MPDEIALPPDNSDEDVPEDDPAAILADGLAGFVNKPEFVEAVSKYVKSAAENLSARPTLTKISIRYGLAFSAMVFVGIALLGWLKVLPPDATAGLLGTLIGYWYGQRQTKP
jgi:hypothetical protein